MMPRKPKTSDTPDIKNELKKEDSIRAQISFTEGAADIIDDPKELALIARVSNSPYAAALNCSSSVSII